MDVQASVPLALHTTFHIGGPARVYIPIQSEGDTQTAVALAHDRGLPLFVLGAGSNVLVPDEGFDGVVLHMRMHDIAFQDTDAQVEIVADAGAHWDAVVDAACARGLSGVENLAGIPGTVGGAVVQNIGAYGVELAPVFLYADGIDSTTGEKKRITGSEAEFSYRSSFFKRHPEFIITRVAFRLAKEAPLRVDYPDLVRAAESGVPLVTPQDVAKAVRDIRAGKFPTHGEGTAGSFFKNPILQEEQAAELAARFPGLPTFSQGNGMTKVSLSWLLDHALSLKGYVQGRVRLYEKQPLVLVAENGATAHDVDALAEFVAKRVKEATDISIEREVETMRAS